MYNVSTSFHSACQGMSPVTRARIYFIEDTVDFTDDSDVEQNGYLMVFDEDDTDSNGRIDLNYGGIQFTDYFNTGDDIEIGRVSSNTINIHFVNSDGGLNDFAFGRCKVYIDLYVSNAWVSVPLGVFNIKTPTKRKKTTISATGYDLMQLMEADADTWFSSISWSSGVTNYQILTSLASYLGFSVSSDSYGNMVNADYSYTSAPFSAQDMTYKEVLSWLASANCCNARMDRDGYLDLRYYDTVSYGYSEADGFFSIDQGEYSVPQTAGVQVKVTDTDIGVTAGGGNPIVLVNNGFLYGSTASSIQSRADNIASTLTDVPTYSPISFTAQGDWSLEGGDLIPVTISGTTSYIPVMQQKFTWIGGYVKTEVIANGTTGRNNTQSYETRQQISNSRKMHELEVTIDALRSAISDNEGNITEILQTINSISTTVSSVNSSLTMLQTDVASLWTFASTAHVDDNGNTVSISKYIRFDNGDMVLGESDSEMKLRIENDKIVFFSGEDFDENATIYAKFTPEELLDAVVKAITSVYVGNSSDSQNFKQTKTDYNGTGEYTLARV